MKATQGATIEGQNGGRGPVRPGDRRKHRGKNKPHHSMDSGSGSSSSKRGPGIPVMPHDMEVTMNKYWERARQVLGIDVASSKPPPSATKDATPSPSTTSPIEVSSSSPSVASVESGNAMPLPSKSLFPGFSPPDDINTWKIAVQKAHIGEQVLLNKVLEVIICSSSLSH